VRADKNALLTFGAVTDIVTSLKPPSSAPRIMDLGCADGQLLQILRRAGYGSLWGAGFDVPHIDGMKMVSGVDVCESDAPRNCSNGHFDIVIATDVVEHLVNPYQFLKNCRRLLRPDGWLILSFPNVHSVRSIIAYALIGRYSGFFGRNFTDGHPLHDQHIFIPNRYLVEYFLRLNGIETVMLRYVNGSGRLWGQTTVLVGRRRAIETER